MDQRLVLDETEAARYLTDHGFSYKPATLASWRWRGQGRGPAWVKVDGGLVRYPVAGLDEWMAAQIQRAV